MQDQQPARLWTDMTNHKHLADATASTSRRSIAGAALLALIAAACGTTTSTSSTLIPAETIVSNELENVDLILQMALAPTTTAPPMNDAPATIAAPPKLTPALPPTVSVTVPATVPPKVTPTPAPAPTTDPKPTNTLVPVPTVTISQNQPVPPISAAQIPVPAPCGVFDPIPAESQITSDLSVDLDGDGAADDQVITYLDGVYKLRSIQNGVISEVAVPDVGTSSIRALGVGNAGEISPGNEIVVRTGGGSSNAQIGFFGHDDAGCLFTFTRYGIVLEMHVGATVGTSSGVYCADGLIADWSYGLEDDGTYTGSGAAYFESSPGDFTYLPASDDFSEGLALEDLSPADLDCFGFGL